MRHTPASRITRCIGKQRYDKALELAKEYWQLKTPLIGAPTLLAAAYVAHDAEWVAVALQHLPEARGEPNIPHRRYERLAMEISPDEIRFPFSSWRVHAIAGDVLCDRPSSLEAMRRATALYASPETYLWLSRSLANAPNASRDEQLEALTILRRAVVDFPCNVDLRWELASNLFSLGQAKQAETVVEGIDVSEILDQDDVSTGYKQACLWGFIGEIKYALGKREDALAAFNEAMLIYPGYFKPGLDLPLEQWRILQTLQGK